MKILVCNDDGINAPGIDILARSFQKYGEVIVFAPANEQSAKSHSMTFFSGVKAKKIEAMGIVEKAKEDALLERQTILDKAKDEKQAELQRTREEIAQEIEASKDEIHREIVSVAIDASSKVLQREVNKEDNEKLIDRFIDDLKESK